MLTTKIVVEGPVEKIQKLELARGDVLVVQTKFPLSTEETAHIKDSMLAVLWEAGIKVMVLGPGMELYSLSIEEIRRHVHEEE